MQLDALVEPGGETGFEDAHAVQELAPPVEYAFAGQSEHRSAPSDDEVPGAHALQAEARNDE